mmetsp:Transcript_53067/g.164199  ORF Transcript_53067/g.164199 Transcript_53067/m.164199 type:complete len:381 (-) Transcript_53067:25-1167(-)
MQPCAYTPASQVEEEVTWPEVPRRVTLAREGLRPAGESELAPCRAWARARRAGAAALAAAVAAAGTLAWASRWQAPLQHDPVSALEEKAIRCFSGPQPRELWKPDTHHRPVRVKVLTYNLFWWNLFRQRAGNHGSAGKLIASAGRPAPFDFMGFQECEDAERVLRDGGLLDEYTTFQSSRTLCMAYRRSGWSLLSYGHATVAEDHKGLFGQRGAQWMRLQHSNGTTLFFLNHHGPLPVNSGGICGGTATAHNLLRLIGEHAHVGDALILVGDFNANPTSSTVQELRRYLLHVYSGEFLDGIDNIFSNVHGLQVVHTETLGHGGSDHSALSAIVEVGPFHGAVQQTGASPAKGKQAPEKEDKLVSAIIRRWFERPSRNSDA